MINRIVLMAFPFLNYVRPVTDSQIPLLPRGLHSHGFKFRASSGGINLREFSAEKQDLRRIVNPEQQRDEGASCSISRVSGAAA